MEQLAAIDYLMRHVAETLGQQLDQVVQEQVGIGMAQYRILKLQNEQPDILQSGMAAQLGQTEPSITRQVKLLTDKGMLISAVNGQNKRQKQNQLTARGSQMLANADTAIQRFVTLMFIDVSDKQQKQLLDVLALLHQKTCQPGRPYACDFMFIAKDG